MASPTSKTDTFADWQGRVIEHNGLASGLAARREEIGEPATMPRNAGNRRTASKRALLKAIDRVEGYW
ncbi:hypothetical protein ACMGDM_17430 [Sphingomonas sp. DT-51]|uniref:hypothetical protein n=1 Tax=Sphingomonas sp. DT-51 TaxID=3396165 RepID=UPI003F1946EB